MKDNVEKDDPLKLDKAALFDVHMVDEWNKIVNALLTSFIPNSDAFGLIFTNDLLVAIQHQQLIVNLTTLLSLLSTPDPILISSKPTTMLPLPRMQSSIHVSVIALAAMVVIIESFLS